MHDRFADFRSQAKVAPDDSSPAPASDSNMGNFFDDVTTIKDNLVKIQESMKSLEHKYAQSVSVVSDADLERLTTEIDQLSAQITSIAQRSKTLLENMKKSNEGFSGSDAETRMRENMHGTLTRKFIDVMKEFQNLQSKYKAKYRERIERQVKIVSDLPQEEIDELIDSGEAAQHIKMMMAQNVMGKRAADAENAADYIEERHQDIMKLEKSIEELHGLFVDMSLLVQSQGELLDQIEYSVNQSKQYMEETVVHIKKAEEHQQSARKKKVLIVVVCLLILGIVAGIIAWQLS